MPPGWRIAIRRNKGDIWRKGRDDIGSRLCSPAARSKLELLYNLTKSIEYCSQVLAGEDRGISFGAARE